MKIEDILDAIALGSTLVGFEYNGKECHIDPYYEPNTKQHSYLLYCNGNEKTVYSIDEVIRTPFFDDKAIVDIADEIEELLEF